MKKIALIINTLSNGGAERVVSNLTLCLSKYYECDVIVNDDVIVDYPISGKVISLGIKHSENRSSVLYQMKVFFVRLSKLKQIKKQNNYYAVIGFSDSANVANLLSRVAGEKTILSVHINISKAQNEGRYKYIVGPLIKIMYNRADGVVAVSEGIKNDLVRNYGVRKELLYVAPNGCDKRLISKMASEELEISEAEWFDGSKIIVTMGRLTKQKGQWHLVRALADVIKNGYNCKLLVLGQGELEEYLKKIITEFGMDQSIILCGFCSNPFKIMSKSDIFVTSSLWEGYPNNIVEAMSCGLPCISSDFDSGAREIIAPETDIGYKNTDEIEQGQYGILVPVCDGKLYMNEELTREESLLSNAIKELLTNDALRENYKNKASERAEQLDITKTSEVWCEAIESATTISKLK
ncbi:glycosyltransferase [Butyrivibrio sp. YAB3001]|uniref:glycosyltransferase n=1 Tax=Butyrivibrio sp. YAB3001 TaxID=1520812 RepID=UPI0008F66936|nr:glycosyltransferase [Butyrivibrio sp. YAB3001]SFC74146.1 Glycosyltransferase involved in cell wall bisynthesis [Butyrivibrio sp. YAB3001]